MRSEHGGGYGGRDQTTARIRLTARSSRPPGRTAPAFDSRQKTESASEGCRKAHHRTVARTGQVTSLLPALMETSASMTS